MNHALPHGHIPATVASVADYEPLARARLDPAVWTYLAGGAGDGLTIGANRTGLDRIRLRPRVLRPLAGGDTSLDLFGRRHPHPIMLAPIAFQRLYHPEGETATAMAAAAFDAVMIASTLSSVPLEAIAEAGGGMAPQWFQLYWQTDRDASLALANRAVTAGFGAIVLTVDAIVTARDDIRRAGFALPPDVQAANFPEGRMPAAPSRAGHPIFDGVLGAAPTWDDVAWLAARLDVPLVIKGILAPEDAEAAIAAGAAGIVVSNHGGRTLDSGFAAIDALGPIARVVAGRMPILFDGGIRRGTDVLKALALGADSVLVGRPQAMALAVAGARGVAHVLKLLIEETAVAMALCGVARIEDVGPELIAD